MQPDSLHPYIMDKRIKEATGTGGITTLPIASADILGGIKVPADSGITITGSGNAYAYKPTNYTTAEHKTGRKWLDGSDIYEKTISIDATELIGGQSYVALNDASMFSTFVNSILVVKSVIDVGLDHALIYINVTENKLYLRPMGNWNNITSANLIIEYTKIG